MNSFSGDEPHVSMVRPFLDHRRPLKPAHADDDTVSLTGVRAYAMTGGRAHATVHLEFETMLQATAAGRESLTAMTFEPADIIHMAWAEPWSVAELSARLQVRIGVVGLVSAALWSEGLLEAFQPSENVADDVLLITRLIAGVRAL